MSEQAKRAEEVWQMAWDAAHERSVLFPKRQARARKVIFAALQEAERRGVEEGYRAGVEAMRRAWEEHEGDYHSPKLHAARLLSQKEGADGK